MEKRLASKAGLLDNESLERQGKLRKRGEEEQDEADEAEEEEEEEDEDEDDLPDISWTGGGQDSGKAVLILDGEDDEDDEKEKGTDTKNDESKRNKKSRKNGKSKRRSRKRQRAELVHRMDLLCLLAKGLHQNNKIDTPSLFEQARNIMPEPFQFLDSAKRVQALVSWFRTTFKAKAEATSLLEVLTSKSGTRAELLLAFIALARSVGNPMRLVVALSPKPRISAVSRRKQDEGGLGQVCWAEAFVTAKSKPREKEVIDLDAETSETNDRSSIEGEWVAVDPLTGAVQSVNKFSDFVTYVVSLGPGGFAMDLTCRYAKQWTRTSRARHHEKDGWWETFTLSPLREKARDWVRSCTWLSKSSRNLYLTSMSPALEEKERQSLQREAEAEDMPTSVEGFRRHKKYVLERHFARHQGLHPDAKAVGVYKGMPVYNRVDVYELKSKTQWMRQAMQVKQDQLDHPAKRVDPIRRNKTFAMAVKDTDSNVKGDQATSTATQEEIEGDEEEEEFGNDTTGKISLYGEWQTEKYTPPSVGLDGVVPKNSHGNVEMWCDACCPKGAVHIRLALAGKAAIKLDIDYAPALVGFEYRDGRHVPKFDGVVVASQFAQVVQDGALTMEQERLEKQIQKRREAILKTWERLTKGILIQHRIQSQYSAESQPQPSALSVDASTPSDESSQHVVLGGRHQACEHDFRRTGIQTDHGVEKRCALCGVTKVVEEF